MLLHQAVPGSSTGIGKRAHGQRRRFTGMWPPIFPASAGLSRADARHCRSSSGLPARSAWARRRPPDHFRQAGVPVFDADLAVARLYHGEAAPLIEEAFPGTVQRRRRRSRPPGEAGAAGPAGHQASRGDRASAGAFRRDALPAGAWSGRHRIGRARHPAPVRNARRDALRRRRRRQRLARCPARTGPGPGRHERGAARGHPATPNARCGKATPGAFRDRHVAQPRGGAPAGGRPHSSRRRATVASTRHEPATGEHRFRLKKSREYRELPPVADSRRGENSLKSAPESRCAKSFSIRKRPASTPRAEIASWKSRASSFSIAFRPGAASMSTSIPIGPCRLKPRRCMA